MNIRFAMKALARMDIKARWTDVKQVARRAEKPKLLILADMLWCAARYGAGPADYRLFEFYNKNAAQRATYITRRFNNELVRRFNRSEMNSKIDLKSVFCRNYSEFTGRAFLPTAGVTQEALAAFCEGKDRVLYKPDDGCCGKGIKLIDLRQWSRHRLYLWLWENQTGVLDELVEQHPDLAALYPGSVNTVRLVTLRHDGVVIPLFAFLRMGMGGNVVDNLNSEGIAAKIDIDSGRITMPAAGKDGAVYDIHPDTGVGIVNFQIPHWDLVLELARRAAEVVPEVGYVGWDIAVRQDDAVLIEGNSYPGHDILQLPAYTPDGAGLRPVVEQYL